MKILVVSNYRGYHTCRPEAEIFIGLKKMGFDITIMTYPDAAYMDRFKESGIKVIPQHPTRKYDPTFIKILHEELVSGKYDILQLYNNKAIFNGLRSVGNIDVKVVIYRGASWNMAWWNPINYAKFFHPRVDYVICNSEEIRRKFHAVPFYKKEKAVVIYKGHQLSWYTDVVKHNIKEELAIDPNNLLFVTVANNRKFKAIPDLLKAMKFIPENAKMSLLIIGRNMDTVQNKKLKLKSGNADKIHFLGFRRDALSIVASCDAFVLPSIGGESLTKSVIEAMCLGVVPIISDIEGNKPLVNHGVNGLIFKKSNPSDLAEKLLYFYKNQDQIANLATGARSKIEIEINNQQTVNAYAKFYRSIIN